MILSRVPRIIGPAALAESDFTARVDLTGFPAGQPIFYRVLFEDHGSISSRRRGRFHRIAC